MPKRKPRPRAAREAPRQGRPMRRRPERATHWADVLMETLLLAAVFAIPLLMDPLARSWTLVKSALMIWLAAAMLLVWIMSALRQGRFSWNRSILNPPALAFIGAGAISMVPSQYRHMGVFPLAERVAFVVFYFCVANWAADRVRAERLLWAAAVALLLTGIYGTFQKYGIDFMHYPERQIRILSSLGNATFFAGYLIVLLPLLATFALGAHRVAEQGVPGSEPAQPPFARRYQAAARALFLLAEACLIWTWTRAAFGGILLGIVALAVLLRWNPLRSLRTIRRKFDWGQASFITSAVVLGVVLVMLSPAGLKILTRRTVSALVIALRTGSSKPVRAVVEQASSGEAAEGEGVVLEAPELVGQVQQSQRRVHMWEAALSTFKRHVLFGSGLGTYQIYMRSHPWSAAKHEKAEAMVGSLHAHNEFLEILSDEGILGMAAFLWLLGAYGLAAVRVLRRADPFWRCLTAGLLAGVLALLAQNLFAISFRQAGVVIYFWLAVGLTAAAQVATAPGEQPRGGFRVPLARGGAAAAVAVLSAFLLTILALGLLLFPVRAERYMFLATNAINRNDVASAAAMLEQQMKLTPRRPEPWAMLGPVYGMLAEREQDPKARKELYEKALRTLLRADQLCPNYRNVRRNLAAAYARLGQRREAIRVLEEAAVVQDAPWLYADMARNHIALGELPEAEARARKAVQQAPRIAEYHNLLGYVLFLRGMKAKAAEEFEAAIRLEPGNAKHYVALGYALVQMGRRPQAVEIFRKALSLAAPGSEDETKARNALIGLGALSPGQ